MGRLLEITRVARRDNKTDKKITRVTGRDNKTDSTGRLLEITRRWEDY